MTVFLGKKIEAVQWLVVGGQDNDDVNAVGARLEQNILKNPPYTIMDIMFDFWVDIISYRFTTTFISLIYNMGYGKIE